MNKVLLLSVGALLLGLSVQAIEKKPDDPREDLIKNLVRGIQFINGRESYVWLPRVHAVSELVSRASQRSLGPLVLEKKGPFSIISASVDGLSQRSSVIPETFPVVLNQRTGQFGVVLGELSVHVKDPQHIKIISRTHGLSIVRRFDHLGVVYMKLHDPANALTIMQKLRDDSFTIRVDLDIFEEPEVAR